MTPREAMAFCDDYHDEWREVIRSDSLLADWWGIVLEFQDKLYCVFFTIEDGDEEWSTRRSMSIKVYRLPATVPAEYPKGAERLYFREFLEFVAKPSPTRKFPYEYELIHADPPEVAK
jgi:hypothetical protein